MKAVPLLTVRHQGLSLWQSVTTEHILKCHSNEKVNTISHPDVQNHLVVQGTDEFIRQAEKLGLETAIKKALELSEEPFTKDIKGYSILAAMCYKIAEARLNGKHLEAEARKVIVRKYSDKDWLNFFEHFVVDYTYYGLKYHGKKKYNAWKQNGGQDFGVIDYKLPNNAKVAIIGDWGTGMPDAKQLLKVLMHQHKPDAIIHLGDIYYAGTPCEVKKNFSDIIDEVFKDYKKRIPVFSIPGNHDYYSFGYAYYEMVKKLNDHDGLRDAIQSASYFNLKTEDGGWQFLAMDTGLDDSDPANQFNPTKAGPFLKNEEFEWHKNKLDTFEGNTILLSHHQLFSGNAEINGKLSEYRAMPYVNKYLLDNFRPYFGHKIAAWFWGHEHNQVMFKDGIFGLPKGRLVGASAYEEAVSETPYKSVYPEVPFNPVELSSSQGYYYHGYAIIDFGRRDNPKASVPIEYFEYPSWGENPPDPIPTEARCLNCESLGVEPKVIGEPISFNEKLKFNLEGSTFNISTPYKGEPNEYAQLGLNAAKHTFINLDDVNSNAPIKHKDTVAIGLNDKDLLSTSSNHHNVYYHKSDSGHHSKWIIEKAYPNDDPVIRKGEPVWLLSAHYKDQFLCPSKELFYKETFLTTSKKVAAQWFLE